MEGAVLYKINAPLQVEKGIEVPEPQYGQVLVKLAFSGLCRSQLMEVKGGRGEDKYLPHLLGHEGTGIVVSVGEGVTKVAKNDFVVLTWIKGEGIDAGGSEYKKGDTVINAGGVTTLSEYSVVSENRCVKLPEGMPLDTGVLLGCALPTGAGILFNELKPEKGNTIAIWGLGGVGLSALTACTLFEFKDIIAVDIEDEKLSMAKELGATSSINASKEDPVQAILELTDGKGLDFVIEASGQSASIEKAFKSVRNHGGLCVFASHPETGTRLSIDPYDLICGKQLRGTWGGGCSPDEFIPMFVKLYRERSLPLDKLLNKSYSLKNINNALKDLEERKIARALIEIAPDLSGLNKRGR